MREEGYYWVKFENYWQIGFFDAQQKIFQWTFIGNDFSFKENELDEIDEKQIKRE